MKFEEISNIMKSKLYPTEDNEIYNITSNNFKDVSFAAIYEKKDCSVRLQSEPVTKSELLGRTQPIFPVDYLDEIPEPSIFYDVDVVKEKLKETDFDEFMKKALIILSKDTQNFNDLLLKI
jgi:hypothetical protein